HPASPASEFPKAKREARAPYHHPPGSAKRYLASRVGIWLSGVQVLSRSPRDASEGTEGDHEEGRRLCSSGARECVDVERKRAECRGRPCVGSGGQCSLRFSTRPRICNDFSGRAGPRRWLIGSPSRAARRVRQLALW